MTNKPLALALAALASLAVLSPAQAQITRTQITRTKANPNSVISTTATVPPGSTLYFIPGTTPAPLDPADPEEMGDTRQQTISVLERIKGHLATLGLGMGDIVKMTVFLVGVPERNGRMDSPAMNEVFRTYFGTPEQPNTPTRSTIQIAALGRPKMYVEIEAIAAKAP